MQNSNSATQWLEQPVHPVFPWLTREVALFAVIIMVTLFTRFYDLGARVMSHDESLHTYFSWLLYNGQGYQHSPMMHGPLQFHLLALSYFLFGVSDFTARIPAILFSIATVAMVWHWRKYLGKYGALAAGIMLALSPMLLFYGRYVRNEVFVGLFGLLMLYGMLRYLETGSSKYIYLISASLALHFTSKETSFIYAAQALVFLAAYFLIRITANPWYRPENYRPFIILLAAGLLIFLAGLSLHPASSDTSKSIAEPLTSIEPSLIDILGVHSGIGFDLIDALVILGLLTLVASLYFMFTGYSLNRLRQERSFGLLILIGTLVLPNLAPFPVVFLHLDPLDYSTQGLTNTGYFLIPMVVIAVIFGLLWNSRVWVKSAILFYGIFLIFYTTFFTNGIGFFTGLIGSLGYWLAQQDVQRGSQPYYYYWMLQIPIYEFLAALGTILAIPIAWWKLKQKPVATSENFKEEQIAFTNQSNMLWLLGYWAVSSLIAYTVAGEKMPWLTYHIAIPMILLAGWALGQVTEAIPWDQFKLKKPVLGFTLLILLVVSLVNMFWSALGATPPFQGNDIVSLQATSTFLLALIATLGSAYGVYKILGDWTATELINSTVLVIAALLLVLTARTAFRASYINYNNAKEYLVYAHGESGVKEVISQITDISRRVHGDLGMLVAYDASAPDTGVSWPMVWYLRDFTNQRSFDTPTRSLREASLIIVDAKNFGKIEQVVQDSYYQFDYIRMVWPNQDYFNLTTERVREAITNPQIRAGIMDIWLNRDYTLYAAATGNQFITLKTWEPADRMRLYVRKDVAAQIWNFGVAPAAIVETENQYDEKAITLSAEFTFGFLGENPGQLNAPRGIAIAPNGDIYVADSRNHRIQRFDAQGNLLTAWGTFGDVFSAAGAPIGTFNEPWGIAVGTDGSVFVTDTWNHRIQKFSADGAPIAMWGTYGLAETPDAFWGPRGIAVSPDGRVFVTDTGNKRIVVFDASGAYLSEFGSVGFDIGQFDEPVGLAIDNAGNIYVADTWNRRIQVFSEINNVIVPVRQWDVHAWFGQSLDNKPLISVNANGEIFAVDPDSYRILHYSAEGNLIATWGDFGASMENFGIPAGVAIDSLGRIWVSDAGNHRIVRFSLP